MDRNKLDLVSVKPVFPSWEADLRLSRRYAALGNNDRELKLADTSWENQRQIPQSCWNCGVDLSLTPAQLEWCKTSVRCESSQRFTSWLVVGVRTMLFQSSAPFLTAPQWLTVFPGSQTSRCARWICNCVFLAKNCPCLCLWTWETRWQGLQEVGFTYFWRYDIQYWTRMYLSIGQSLMGFTPKRLYSYECACIFLCAEGHKREKVKIFLPKWFLSCKKNLEISLFLNAIQTLRVNILLKLPWLFHQTK